MSESATSTKLSPALRRATLAARRADTRHLIRERRAERAELERLQRFYRDLERGDRAFYMFFSGGLLHWALAAQRTVPREVPLVLLTTGLSAEEQQAARRATGRPLHNIDLQVDDASVLDLLSETVDTGFGWMHIDCFVLDPRLFAEIADEGYRDAVRCVWTTGSIGPTPIAHSAFAFFEVEPIRALRAAGLRASLKPHQWDTGAIGRYVDSRPAFDRVPTARELAAVRHLLPGDADEPPPYPEGFRLYTLLSWYQLLAHAHGYVTRPIREYSRTGGASSGQFSRDIVHINGVATYRRVWREWKEYLASGADPGDRVPPLVHFYPQLLQIDLLLLRAALPALPPSYGRLYEELCSELAAIGLEVEGLEQRLGAFLERLGVDPRFLGRLFALQPA